MASLFLFRTSAPATIDENSDNDHHAVTAGSKAEGVGVAHIVDADTPHSGGDADGGIKGEIERTVGSAAAMGAARLTASEPLVIHTIPCTAPKRIPMKMQLAMVRQ